MNRKIITTTLIAFICLTINAQDKFKITRENKTSEHELGINKYSFIHHLCPDSFFMTELYKNYDYEEMTSILREVYDGVTYKDKVQVNFKEVKPAPAKITYSIKEIEDKEKIFIMFTNFSNATRQFEKKPDPKDQLARWYFLKNDRLIYRKDLFTPETEELKLKSDRKSDIIKYYIFDDNSDNDSQIKPMIDEILASDDNGPDNYFTQIYQIQYYLMNGQIQEAEKALHSLEDYFYLNTEIPRNQKIYLNMVKAEFEVMNRM
ncbi:hypothetical protein ACFQO1_05250 [Jejudonia soesokkakensis]|uniref:Tetratricopeptide repeat protein n=1 Tax=Jejudonia soesokkakensis TaxID=1323432 RepID=A0ABW2MT60_9FLAO